MDRTGEKQKKVVYDFICDDLYTPMKFKEMAMLLQVPKTRRQELKEVLEELEAEGKIAVSRRGKYYKGEAEKKTGIYRATRKGFGFVTVPEEETDIYIAQEDQGGAFDGDEVEVQITGRPSGRNQEGKILRILARGHARVVGLYQRKPKQAYGFVLGSIHAVLRESVTMRRNLFRYFRAKMQEVKRSRRRPARIRAEVSALSGCFWGISVRWMRQAEKSVSCPLAGRRLVFRQRTSAAKKPFFMERSFAAHSHERFSVGKSVRYGGRISLPLVRF